MSSNELHLRMSRRLRIECSIQLGEDLHLGAGRGDTAISASDLPIQRDGQNHPIIPGSSLRGAFRAMLHRLLNSLSDSKSLLEDCKVIMSKEEERAFIKADNKDDQFSSLGVIDLLFGVSGFASPLRFTDAHLSDGGETRRRMHVSIDLGTDRAKEGALIDLEAVTTATSFKSLIVFDELADKAMRIPNKVFYTWLQAFASEEGVEMFLGGWKSRGYGQCTIKITALTASTPRQLIFGEAAKTYKGSETRSFLTTVLKQLQEDK